MVLNLKRKQVTMTDKEIIIDGKIIGCPCYIDRPLHRYHKGCLVQSQAFKEQQTEEKPILRCDEIKNCPIKENFKQLQFKTAECEKYEQALDEFELLITNHISSCEKCPDNKNGYCIGIDECSSRCLKKILGIINKAKGDN